MRHYCKLSLSTCYAPITNSLYISFHVRPIKVFMVEIGVRASRRTRKDAFILLLIEIGVFWVLVMVVFIPLLGYLRAGYHPTIPT
jgi:hypothetical protein